MENTMQVILPKENEQEAREILTFVMNLSQEQREKFYYMILGAQFSAEVVKKK